MSIPYISRILNPQGVGLVSFIDSFTYYFIVIAELGIVVYGIREVARVREDKAALEKLVSELLALHLISSFFTMIIYAVAVYFAWDKIRDPRLLMFSFSFLLVNSFVCEWYYWGLERFKFITTRSLFTRIAGLISIFILIKEPDDYYLYYGIIVGAAIGNILLSIGNLLTELKLSFRNANWKRHISRTWVTYSISLLYCISVMLDNVLLGFVATSAFVAFYAFAIKLIRLSSVAITDTLLVFFPHAVALLHAKEHQKFQQVILQSVRLIILFSVPVSAGVFLFADEIVMVFFGPSFQQIAYDLKILSVIPILKCYNLYLSKQVLLAYDREKLYVRSLLIAGVLFIGGTLILSSMYQDVGACYAMVGYEAILVVMNLFYVRKTAGHLKIYDWKVLMQAVFGIALFVPIRYFFDKWDEVTWVSLSIVIILCAILYLLFQVFVMQNELFHAWSLSRTRSRDSKRK